MNPAPDPLRRGLILGGALAFTGALARAEGEEERTQLVTSPGKHTLSFDLPGVEIGCATDPKGPTGCTVLHFPRRVLAVADVRGGAAITSSTDLPRESAAEIDAICLAGGSTYGLAAADGVARELFQRRKRSTAWDHIARVCGAVCYDFGLRTNTVLPDAATGRAALRAAKAGVVGLGGIGAGASASVGKWFPKLLPELAGQGAAFRRVGPTRVLVLSVVNALGAIVNREGQVVRGHRHPTTGKRYAVKKGTMVAPKQAPSGGNTTLTVVATNRRLSVPALRQLAKEVHTSMARALHPFHTGGDGDVLFALTTATQDDPRLNAYSLAAIASDLAWDAVLASYRGR
jgi:L-aminopeptidase/D-esterase-like protein